MTDRPTSRRSVLKRLGAGVCVVGTGGFRHGDAEDSAGRYVVGAATGGAARAARARARSVSRVLDFDDVGTTVAGTFSPEDAAALGERHGVRYVQEPVRLEAVAERETGQTVPWGVDRIDADVAHANGNTGEGAHVAIVDTGITATHPDLRANLGDGRAFVQCTSGVNVRCTVDPETGRPQCEPVLRRCRRDWGDDVPQGGHGTHVAGTIGAADNDDRVLGVAPDATLHALKVLNTVGVGNSPAVAAGVKYAADRGWDVVNMSLGAPESSPVIEDAVDYAVDRDVVVVAAAGNSGPRQDTVEYPGRHPNVVAVSATARADSLAGFSSRGANVTVAAPGADVCSTIRGGAQSSISGTSMASPHVAGVAALLLADGTPPGAVRDRITDTAEDVGLPETAQGAGLVDAAAALGLDSDDDGTGSGVCNPPPAGG